MKVYQIIVEAADGNNTPSWIIVTENPSEASNFLRRYHKVGMVARLYTDVYESEMRNPDTMQCFTEDRLDKIYELLEGTGA